MIRKKDSTYTLSEHTPSKTYNLESQQTPDTWLQHHEAYDHYSKFVPSPMQKILGLLLVCLFLWNCKKVKSTSQHQGKETRAFQYQKMPPERLLSPKATVVVKQWEPFNALSESVEILYKARNYEEVLLAIEDLIEKEKWLTQESYPELFDITPIQSRQLVLRTYLHKAKFIMLQNQPTTESVIAILEAYNAFRKQLNLAASSRLEEVLSDHI